MDAPKADVASGILRPTLPASLGRLVSGAFWLALQVPVQIVLSIWSLRLIVEAIGPEEAGAYRFACGLGFFQLLFEVGVGPGLQRRISAALTCGDRSGVNRVIALGMNLCAAMALAQIVTLSLVAFAVLPHAGFGEVAVRLIARLLCLQAVTTPFFGVAVIVSCVLQAARRYDFVPRYELAITVLRFLILIVGVKAGIGFFAVIVVQTALVLGLRILPALRVMVRELGQGLRFVGIGHSRGTGWNDYKSSGKLGFCVIMLQVGVVLGDRIDTTILALMLSDPGPQIAAYDLASKPFTMLRQSSWMLASVVMPAVANLAASRDENALDRVKFVGTRIHVALLLPIGLQTWVYAGPLLSLWFGQSLGYDASDLAPLVRLFLIAAIPFAMAVPIQIAIGLDKVGVIAASALFGWMASLPLSCYLTFRLGVAGVIWANVLTTLLANLLVPAIYLFRSLKIKSRHYLRESFVAPLFGGFALIGTSAISEILMPVVDNVPMLWSQTLPLMLHLAVSTFAYIVGYSLDLSGRRDLYNLIGKIRS